MSITVEMSAPYLGLPNLVRAMADAVVKANRSSEELQNPEEMHAAAALAWESKLRDLQERNAIKGHDFDTLAAEDWKYLKTERDCFFVDDLNDCDELTRVGFRFVVVEEKDDLVQYFTYFEEGIYNESEGVNGIDWKYWVWRMPLLSPSEAARLLAGLDPDLFKDLSVSPNKNDTSKVRKRALNIERLAIREGREADSAFNWLLWAKEQGFEVHGAFSIEVNRKREHDEAMAAFKALPAKEASYWEQGEVQRDGRTRQVAFTFAGNISTRHFELHQFVAEVTDRLERWQEGNYAVIEAAQVIADANSGIDAHSLCEQMEDAMHDGKLVLRKNDVPLPKADVPRGRLWNRYVRAEDVNDWLTASRARYRLAYPYQTTAKTKPQERRVSDEDWKELARKRAAEIVREQRARDLFPSQESITYMVAKGFREQGIVGADGKPLSGATIKRHALKGISSAIGKQLSTAPRQGK